MFLKSCSLPEGINLKDYHKSIHHVASSFQTLQELDVLIDNTSR